MRPNYGDTISACGVTGVVVGFHWRGTSRERVLFRDDYGATWQVSLMDVDAITPVE
jgi:hypothetical protein